MGYAFRELKDLSPGIVSDFGHVKKLPLNRRKPENSSVLRLKNTKEIILNHNGSRMVKNGKD